MTPPSDVKDALDQLAKNLSDQDPKMASAGFEKSDETEPNGGVDLAGTPQSARDASAIAGIGMVAISKQDSAQSDAPPGMGAGGHPRARQMAAGRCPRLQPRFATRSSRLTRMM